MTRVILMEATPRDPGVGIATVRASTALKTAKAVIETGGGLWLPAITREPRYMIDIFGSELTGQLRVDYGTIGLRFAPALGNDVWSRYIWDGALLKLWIGQAGEPLAAYTQIFEGRAGPLERDSANAGSLQLRGPEADLDKPLLTSSYTGTGGAEGNASMKGVFKPWCSGPAEGVPGVLIDKINWVWQVHGYSAIDDVAAAYEGGIDKGASSGDFASYAALIAATLTEAQWATCKAEGLVRFGGEPRMRVSFDVRGAKDGATFPARAGAIASHLIRHAGVASGKVSTASAAAFDAAFPEDWCAYQASQVTVGELVRKAMADFGAYAFPDGAGVWRFGPWRFGKTATVLRKARDQLPLVKSVRQEAAAAPVGEVRVGARRCWGVHSEQEISPALIEMLNATFQWKGAYSAGATYSVGHGVRWEVADGGDGATYVRIGIGDTTGVAPSDGTKWELFLPAATAVDGVNSATVLLFRRTGSATPPAVPDNDLIYTFATGGLAGDLDGWARALATSGGEYRWMISATASSTDATDTITPGEWPTPAILAQDGTGGTPGLNQAIVTLYKRGATTPAMPIGTFTYTFATGLLTGGTLNGWTQLPQATDGNPQWIIQATAIGTGATDTIAHTEFSTAVKQVEDGAPGSAGAAGLNSATVMLYRRAASAPAVPGTTATYTFATGVLTGHNNGWTQAVPATDGNPLWVTLATASATGATDTIATGEWAAVSKMVEDGAGGAAGLNSAVVTIYARGASAPAAPSGTFTYTFATGALSGGTLGIWSQAVPATNGNPLWVRQASAVANTATDSIAAAEFSAAVKMVEDGATGAPGLSIAATPPVINVGLFPNGSPKPGELPQTTQLIVYDGSTDVTASASYTLLSQTNCTAAHVSGGQFNLSAVTALPASFTVQASYGGKTISMKISIAAPKDGPAASRNSSALGAPNSSGSLVSIGSVDLVVAAGATINVSGSLTYRCSTSGGGTRTVQLAAAVSLENLTDGGSPLMSSEVNGSTAVYITGDGDSEVGQVGGSASYTNSTGAPKTFRGRFYTRKIAGNGTARTGGGDYSGTVEISAA